MVLTKYWHSSQTKDGAGNPSIINLFVFSSMKFKFQAQQTVSVAENTQICKYQCAAEGGTFDINGTVVREALRCFFTQWIEELQNKAQGQ